MNDHFCKSKISTPPLNMDEKNCDLLVLDINKFDEFIAEMAKYCEIHYISKSKLKERITITGKCKQEILSKCIPDKGNVMAGEFGEILATELMVDEIKSVQNGTVYNPYKLRWKEDRNKAAQKTDVVLINKNTENLNIYSAEVKVKSDGCSEKQLYEMFAGIIDDRAKRLAVTLYWLSDKENINGERRNIDFIESVIEKYKNFQYDTKINKNYIGVLLADKDIDSIKKFRSIKPKITVNANSLKPVRDVLINLGAYIENNKTIDFSSVNYKDIIDLPEKRVKDRKNKEKVINWYESANLCFGERESLNIKIIEIDKLKLNYEMVYDSIIN